MEEIQELYYVGACGCGFWPGKRKDENEDSEEDAKNSVDESKEELNSKTLDNEDTEYLSEDWGWICKRVEQQDIEEGGW